MNDFGLPLFDMAGMIVFFVVAVYQIRKRRVQRISYINAIVGIMFGFIVIDDLNIRYLKAVDIDTFIKYQSLEMSLTTVARGIIIGAFGILLIAMAVTRRRMHAEWFAAQGTSIIPLYQEITDLAAVTKVPPPFAIKTHMMWRTIASSFAVVGVFYEILCIWGMISEHLGDWVVFAGIQIPLLLTFGFVVGLLSAGRPRLIILPDEVRLRQFAHTTRIRWEDIRLFALIQKDQIELASTNRIIRIPRLERKSTYQPTIPFDDYTRLMDSLLLTVAERTGLSLTDLRDRTPF